MDRYQFMNEVIIPVINKDENLNLPIICEGEWISIGKFFQNIKR